MNEQPVKWFRDSAARFIELLKDHSWNESVRLLRTELAAAKDRRK